MAKGTTLNQLLSIAVFASLLLATEHASANGFRNPPGSASAIGLDGAKSVLVDDVTAISVNPANLTQLKKPTASATITFIETGATFTSPMGQKSEARSTLKTLPNIHAAIPLGDGDMVFGLGITTPYGQSIEWSKGSSLPYFSEMVMVDISPTLAAKLSDKLSIGASLDIYTSELELKQLIPWAMVTGNPAAPMGAVTLEGDGMAVGATLAMTWNLTEKQHVAVIYRSPFDIDYEGDTRVSNIPAPLAPVASADTDFETTFKFPTVASLAYAIDLTDTVTVCAEIEWVEFSRFETLPLDVGANNGLGLFPSEIPQNWDDIWTYGAAASWAYSDSIEVRGTYRYMESPIPDMTLAPTLPDGDKHTLGLGVGWQGERQGVDLAYIYSIIEDRDISENQNPMYQGSYELDSHIVSVSYSRSL
jgi:long-chain fatty acid transport protein